MKRYSLTTLLLVMVIAALVVSQIAMVRTLRQARREVEAVRRNYGHISVDDPSLTYVHAFAENVQQGAQSVRIVVPAGSYYLLHLSDTTFGRETSADSLPATSTIVLHNWRDGADTILTWEIGQDGDTPVVHVRTDTEEFFHYRVENWVDSGQPQEGTFISSAGQRSFTVDETISIATWRDTGTDRGIAIWLEPKSKSKTRSGSKKRFVD